MNLETSSLGVGTPPETKNLISNNNPAIKKITFELIFLNLTS